ncbi:unnamed protein product [Choristocarpus tenellus]
MGTPSTPPNKRPNLQRTNGCLQPKSVELLRIVAIAFFLLAAKIRGMQSETGCECLLDGSDVFQHPQDGGRRSLCLTEATLEHTDANGKICLLSLGDVVGASATQKADTNGSTHSLEVYAYCRNN